MMYFWIVLISFIMEATFSIYISIFTRYFLILFTFISLMVCESYFRQLKSYYWFCFAIGLIYDITFTNTFLFHGILFTITAYLYKRISNLFPDTWYHKALFLFFIITVYRMLSYGILIIIGYLPLQMYQFVHTLIASFLLNIIYGVCLYQIEYIFDKKKYKKRWSK